MKRLFVITFLLAAFSVQAQKTNFWQKANDLLTKVKGIDSTYIYQPKQGFTLGVFSTTQQVGFNTKAKFNVLFDDGSITPEATTYTLVERPSTKLGLELGYGKFVLGFGIEVGPKKAYKKQALGLNLLGKAWGLHFNFFKVSHNLKSNIEIGTPNEDNYWKEQSISSEPAMLKYLSLDGYYVFNNRKFAYPAAYKAGLVQRKTAGSWMVTGRFMQGKLLNFPNSTEIHDYYNLLDRFSTLQLSVGGGYSVNFVCWHKDPFQLRDKGLRNLTINLTLLPVVTAINYLKVTTYDINDHDADLGKHKSTTLCYPMPNIIGGSAVSLTLDRFFISTQFVYDWSYFHNAQAINPIFFANKPYLEDVTLRGAFHYWKLKLLFTYKF